MYLVDTQRGDAAKKTAADKKPFGMGLDAETVAKVETVEIHGTSIKDPGDDYCLYVAKDANGAQLATHRQEGY